MKVKKRKKFLRYKWSIIPLVFLVSALNSCAPTDCGTAPTPVPSKCKSCDEPDRCFRFLDDRIWKKSRTYARLREAEIADIATLVDSSGIQAHVWQAIDWDAWDGGKGRAQYVPNGGWTLRSGYFKGMALSYARSYARLKLSQEVGIAMSAPVQRTTNDVLYFYRRKVDSFSQSPGEAEVKNLRALYCLLIGMGKHESNGKYFQGRDRNMCYCRSTSAESGLFQTSYNVQIIFDQESRKYRPHAILGPGIDKLLSEYDRRPQKGYLSVFHEGFDESLWGSRPSNFFGEGQGRLFQELSRYSPSFAAESTALSLRYRAWHWAAVRTGLIEMNPKCYEILKGVERLVDSSGNYHSYIH